MGQSLEMAEFKEDEEMREKAKRVIEILEGFGASQIDDKLLITVLKTQELVKELVINVDND